MTGILIRALLLAPLLALSCGLLAQDAKGQTMGAYSALPEGVGAPGRPAVLILLSNNHTGFYNGYNDLHPSTGAETTFDPGEDYYGYFDPAKRYSYTGSYFAPDRSGPWSGNFLNWLTMSHADFLRKALTGGRRAIDSVDHTLLERADIPDDGHAWTKQYRPELLPADGPAPPLLADLTPYGDPQLHFTNLGTTLRVEDSDGSEVASFEVRVEVCSPDVPLEANCTAYGDNYKPQGLLQRYQDRIDFGLMTYSHTRPDQGGILRRNIGSVAGEFSGQNGQEDLGISGMIRYINSFTPKGWDPLGEMYYEALRYFRALPSSSAFCIDANSDDGYPALGSCQSNPNRLWDDPVRSWCQQNAMVILNDEYPSRDSDGLPGAPYGDGRIGADGEVDAAALTCRIGAWEGLEGTLARVGNIASGTEDDDCTTSKRLSDLGAARGICPSEGQHQGSFHLAGLAHYGFTADLRELPGQQRVRTYSIAFRASPDGYQVPPPPLNPLWLAAKYGNFDDRNGNGRPDLPREWDGDGDGRPDGFFYAERGGEVEAALNRTFEDVLRRTAAGAAVALQGSSGSSERTLLQPYYRPAVASGENDVLWTGYLRSLWLDPRGNLREDTNANLALDLDADRIVRTVSAADGTTAVKLYPVSEESPFPGAAAAFETVSNEALQPLWEAGKTLAQTDPAQRRLFIYLDRNGNQGVDRDEFVPFALDRANDIAPYLGLADDSAARHLGPSVPERAHNLIQYLRGYDPLATPEAFAALEETHLRPRQIDGATWKLGDIVHSAPVSISSPPDRFGLIYQDASFQAYFERYRDREAVVYVGANDGMLHAFTAWHYDGQRRRFVPPAAAPAGEAIGSELWAYLPQALLPHLKWLPRTDYSHVYYLDQTPRIFDARIFADDEVHPGGWGTVLVVGLGRGGGSIQVTGAFETGSKEASPQTRTFAPCYVALDITEPRRPQLLWERSYEGLGMSSATPAVVRLGACRQNGPTWEAGRWFLLFGSGPQDHAGRSSHPGYVYVVDLATGEPHRAAGHDWLFQTGEDQAVMASAASLDWNLNYNVDAIYLGQAQPGAGGRWNGALYRVGIPWQGEGRYGDTVTGSYSTSPAEWTFSRLFSAPGPVTEAPALATDQLGNGWVFFGTGRDLEPADRLTTASEHLYGLKDPFFNQQQHSADNYFLNPHRSLSLGSADLFDAQSWMVFEDGSAYDQDRNRLSPYAAMVASARRAEGWQRSLEVAETAERALSKPTVLGGLALFPTFLPGNDPCGAGGNSFLYGLYFETGTPYARPVFASGDRPVTVGGQERRRLAERIGLGAGTPSQAGLHAGRQRDGSVSGFIQKGNGEIPEIPLRPPFSVRSGVSSWEEK